MVPFEQFGLQNISKLSQDAQEACDFSSLFVIQPLQHLSSIAETSKDAILSQGSAERAISAEAMESYFNYPLVFQTRIADDQIELDLTYYADIVSEQQLEALCQHYGHVCATAAFVH